MVNNKKYKAFFYLQVKRIIISTINSFATKEINIAIFILAGIFLISNPIFSVSEDSIDLGGKYKNYNVILLIFDALRPDHLGCYGYTRNTSPAIDTLAQQGVVFTNAFSQSSVTLPSVASIFTALYPFSHNVKHVFKDRLPQRVYTLAQILHIYGYATVWFGSMKDAHTGRAPGMLKGFDDKRNLRDTTTALDTTSVLSWIRLHQKENFFVTVHSYRTHNQHFPIQRFNNKFSRQVPKAMIASLDAIWEKSWKSIQEKLRVDPRSIYNAFGKEWVNAHRKYFMRPYSKKNIKRISQLMENQKQSYELDGLLWRQAHAFFESFNKEQLLDFLLLLDSSIFEIDNTLIKQLVDELKKINSYDKTIIIITADHGNEFKEHGHIGHSCCLYDESIHVPLIFHLPRFREGVKIEELAESVDILPTVLDLLGIPIPYQSQGISLVGSMERSKSALTNKYVLSQSIEGLAGIRSKEWKLIIDYERSKQVGNIAGELFDMERDPRERHNIIDARPDVAKELQEYLRSKLADMVIYRDAQGEFMPIVDEETKERIKKTGYW